MLAFLTQMEMVHRMKMKIYDNVTSFCGTLIVTCACFSYPSVIGIHILYQQQFTLASQYVFENNKVFCFILKVNYANFTYFSGMLAVYSDFSYCCETGTELYFNAKFAYF